MEHAFKLAFTIVAISPIAAFVISYFVDIWLGVTKGTTMSRMYYCTRVAIGAGALTLLAVTLALLLHYAQSNLKF